MDHQSCKPGCPAPKLDVCAEDYAELLTAARDYLGDRDAREHCDGNGCPNPACPAFRLRAAIASAAIGGAR